MTFLEDGPLIKRVQEMERSIGQGNWEEGATYFTSNVGYHVARRGSYLGIDGIRAYMDWQRRWVTWTGHSPRMMITHGMTVIIEVTSHFHRLGDDAKLAIPCTDIYRFEGARICDWRVYADTSTFFGPSDVRVPAPKEITL